MRPPSWLAARSCALFGGVGLAGLGFVALELAACGPRAVPPSATPVAVEGPVVPSPPPGLAEEDEEEPALATHAATPELLRALPEDAGMVLWVDLEAFRRSPLHPPIAPFSAAWFDALKDGSAKVCPGNPLSSLKELAAGEGTGGVIIALRLDRPATAWEGCMRALFASGFGVFPEGEPKIEVRVVDSTMIVAERAEGADDGLDRLRGKGPHSPLGVRLGHRAQGATLAFEAQEDGLALRFGTSDIDLELVHEAGSAEAAQRDLEDAQRSFSAFLAGQAAARLALSEEIRRYLSAHLRLSAQGTKVRAALRGPLDARLAESVVHLAAQVVRTVLAEARTAEARSQVSMIAERLASVMNDTPPRPYLIPLSAPRTPARLPPPEGYVPGATDFAHATWKTIDVPRPGRMRYSLEVETSRDRRHAIVRARGDLDGDGLESRFELRVSLGKDTATVDYPIQETNPGE